MITPEMKEVLVHYNQGLTLYKDQKFKEALDCFKKGLEIDKNYFRRNKFMGLGEKEKE